MHILLAFVWALAAAEQAAEGPRAGLAITTSGRSVLAMDEPGLDT